MTIRIQHNVIKNNEHIAISDKYINGFAVMLDHSLKKHAIHICTFSEPMNVYLNTNKYAIALPILIVKYYRQAYLSFPELKNLTRFNNKGFTFLEKSQMNHGLNKEVKKILAAYDHRR